MTPHMKLDEKAVEAVAIEIWNDFCGRHGGTWPGADSQLISVVQCMATARAALQSASAHAPQGGMRVAAQTNIWTERDGELEHEVILTGSDPQ